MLKKLTKTVRQFIHKKPDFSYLPFKQQNEMKFWTGFVDDVIRWYRGELTELFGVPVPDEHIKVTDYTLKENAIRTWIKIDGLRYLNALKIRPDAYSGSRVLDVGCGPIPHLQCLESIERYGLDQLINEYKKIGFPLDRYDPPINYLIGNAEAIPAPDDHFDVVLSVNAIDHVDNFSTAAKEITRVLKPDGRLRMQVHYHLPSKCEPWQLNDEIIRENFGTLSLEKIDEKPVKNTPDETLTIWSGRKTE